MLILPSTRPQLGSLICLDRSARLINYGDSKQKKLEKISRKLEYRKITNNSLMKKKISDTKVHGANVGPTWVLSAPDGTYVGTMNLVIRDPFYRNLYYISHNIFTWFFLVLYFYNHPWHTHVIFLPIFVRGASCASEVTPKIVDNSKYINTKKSWQRLYITLEKCHIDGFVQNFSNSIAIAMELLQSCTKPSTRYLIACILSKTIMIST